MTNRADYSLPSRDCECHWWTSKVTRRAFTMNAMKPEEKFALVVERLASEPGVTVPNSGGIGFGASALRVHNKIFAMVVRNNLVVKLPVHRVDELVESDDGVRFDPRHDGRFMKEWLVLYDGDQTEWLLLAAEAMKFVSAKG